MLTTKNYSISSVDYTNFHSCPEEYKNYVIRILAIQAYAELCGAVEVGYQLRIAPNYRTRHSLSKIVYDEANHAALLYTILENLGINEKEAIAIALGNEGLKTQSLEGVVAVGDNENDWLDLILNNFFMDRAGAYMVANFAESSFAPWAEACKKIYTDEQWHKKFGLDQLKVYLANNDYEDQLLRKKFSIWYVRALNFFGPNNNKSQALLAFYGIKRKANHELRSEFILEVADLLSELKIEHLLSKNISEHYPYSIN